MYNLRSILSPLIRHSLIQIITHRHFQQPDGTRKKVLSQPVALRVDHFFMKNFQISKSCDILQIIYTCVFGHSWHTSTLKKYANYMQGHVDSALPCTNELHQNKRTKGGISQKKTKITLKKQQHSIAKLADLILPRLNHLIFVTT